MTSTSTKAAEFAEGDRVVFRENAEHPAVPGTIKTVWTNGLYVSIITDDRRSFTRLLAEVIPDRSADLEAASERLADEVNTAARAAAGLPPVPPAFWTADPGATAALGISDDEMSDDQAAAELYATLAGVAELALAELDEATDDFDRAAAHCERLLMTAIGGVVVVRAPELASARAEVAGARAAWLKCRAAYLDARARAEAAA
jgi:hypothetical protein